MTLLEKQFLFSKLISKFILELGDSGYGVTLGEAHRSDETAAIYAAKGKGILKSVHRIRLAFDLNLFKDGIYLTRTESYLEAGELWESYSTEEIKCCWGGRFMSLQDGNHFSIEHDGTR